MHASIAAAPNGKYLIRRRSIRHIDCSQRMRAMRNLSKGVS
jgi:hypothetical protein